MDLKMTIAYKKKYLNLNLIYALLFTVTLFTVDLKSEENWKLIIGILVPASFISKYFYQKQKKYLTIENNKIKVNNIFGSEINLIEILFKSNFDLFNIHILNNLQTRP